MFKHYKKLNKFLSLLMFFVMFSFFECNFHASAEASNHQNNLEQSYDSLHEKLCFNDQTNIYNSQNNYQIIGLATLPTDNKIVFFDLLSDTQPSFSNLSIPPPDNKLYLKNNILLI